MTDDMQPWPTLTDFLDAGGDPSLAWDYDWKYLLGFLFGELASFTPSHRERFAELWKGCSEETLEECNRERDPAFERTAEHHFHVSRVFAWEAEMAADPALEARVLAMIPPDWRDYANLERDLWKRPYPLVIKASPGALQWNCAACGAAFEPDVEAIVVTDRSDEKEPNHSHLESEIEYCRDCIAMALAAYDAGRVQ